MSSTSRPVRTYSRRQSMKNASGVASMSPGASGSLLTRDIDENSDERPKKRRTLLKSPTRAEGQEDPTTPKRKAPTRTLPGSRELSPSPELPTAPSSPVPESTTVEGYSRLSKGKTVATNGHSPNISTHSVVLPDMILDTSRSASQLATSLPMTPSRKPKDLSGIFEAASPRGTSLKREGSQNSPSKSGITKKMLPRSRTESSLESSPSRSSQLTPKSKSFNTMEQPHLETQKNGHKKAAESPVASGSQSQRENLGTGRTYAGKSRSFLVALPAASLVGKGEVGIKLDAVDGEDEEYTRDSYAELRKRFGVDNSEGISADSGEVDCGGEGLSLYNPLSSITDLRSKGESRRFRDEVGYLFEGLEPNGALSVRRSSAFDIVSKLSDQDFWRRAKAAGLILDIWERLRGAGAGSGDKVLDPILCCFVSLASEDPRDMTLLASKEDFVETIVQLMVTHAANDPMILAANEKMKLTKAERLTLNRLRDMMSTKTSTIHEECQPNIRLLLSFALSAASTLAFPHLNVILDSVLGDLASVCGRLAAYKSGVALFTDPADSVAAHEKLCLDHVYNCLAILDLYLIEAESLGGTLSLSKTDLRSRYRTLPTGLVALLAVSDIIDRTETSDGLRSQGMRCSELAFRVLINLTNGSSTWTDAVAADPYTLPTTIRLIMNSHRSLIDLNNKKIEADEVAQGAVISSMDHLCLALALLTNLLQERDNLAFSLQNIMIDPACKGQRACLLGCRCSNGGSAVSALVNMYISFLKGEDEDLNPDIQFLRGHLSVLVGLLILQLYNPDNSDKGTPVSSIIEDLPGPAESPLRKLDALIANVEIFSSLYASMTSKVARSNNASDQREESSSSDGVMGRNGSDVVADVVVSLRALRANL